MHRLVLRAAPVLMALALASPAEAARPSDAAVPARPAPAAIHYRTETIDGVKLFYREAGPVDGPVVLLLHGFPSSSHMFRNLIPLLADKYRVIAPDYPGFGQSDAPDPRQFTYSFAHLAEMMDALVQRLGAKSYAMYVMDIGAPVGYRLALSHPERVRALIVQNGNAYEEGLGAFWDPLKAYWAEGTSVRREALAGLVALEPPSSNIPTEWATCRGSARTIGCTTRRCSIGPATRRSSSTSPMTIAPTCRFTRNSRPSSVSAAHRR